MNYPPIFMVSRRRSPQRSQSRPAVEVLDTRRLMASGVTGTALQVYYDQYVGQPIATMDPANPDLPQTSGRPVPLVDLIGPAAALEAAGYTASVDWGDGTRADAGSFSLINSYPYGSPTNPYVIVTGPDHTYQHPGTYTINVAVVIPGDPGSAHFQTSAHVVPEPFSILGQLNPASDSGVSHLDRVTNVRRPNFFGTTQPGATVRISVSNTTQLGSAAVTVGTGKANARGFWSITTTALRDGSYFVGAEATGRSGATATLALTGSIFQPLVIDTAGPKVVGAHVANGQIGTFAIGFTDPDGLLYGPLTSSSSYTVTTTTAHARKGSTLSFTNLTVAPPPSGPVPSTYTTDPVLVTGQIGGGTAENVQNGTFVITVHAAAIRSLAGTPLDGEYQGKFPSGNGRPGGDFRVKVTIRDGV